MKFIEREDWVKDAACRGRAIKQESSHEFFPTKGEHGFTAATETALQLCARCPVKEECLDFAVRNGIEYGIFGGLTGRERRNIRKRSRKDRTFDRDVEIVISEQIYDIDAAIGQ